MKMIATGPSTMLRAVRVLAAAAAGCLQGAGLPGPTRADTIVIDFESVTPHGPLNAQFWEPNPGFAVAGATFSSGSYQGFVVSQSRVTGTGGYFYPQAFGPASAAAEISAESHGGAGGGFAMSGSGQFAVGYNAGSTIDLPSGYRPTSVYATNVATTAWLLANPDPNMIATPLLTDGQRFRVIFTGWSGAAATGTALGSVTLDLGLFSGGSRTVVTDWTLVDLTNLGAASSISLGFTSYDVLEWDGETYISTPTYVALDNLTLAPVPEPATWTLLIGAAVVIGCRLRARRHAR